MSDRAIKLLLILLTVLSAILVSSLNYTIIAIALASISLLFVFIARQIDRYLDKGESIGLYLLILLAIVIGVALGALYSRTLYSIILSLSTTISALVYSIVVIRGTR